MSRACKAVVHGFSCIGGIDDDGVVEDVEVVGIEDKEAAAEWLDAHDVDLQADEVRAGRVPVVALMFAETMLGDEIREALARADAAGDPRRTWVREEDRSDE